MSLPSLNGSKLQQCSRWHVLGFRPACHSLSCAVRPGTTMRPPMGHRHRQPAAISCSLREQQQGDSPSPAQRVQRALGVDYGRKVVGLAVSTLGLAPRPLDGLPGTHVSEQLQLAASVLAVAQREACDAIVVGLPVTQAGSLRRRITDSQQGRRCRNFAGNLAAVSAAHRVTVFLVDERGSSMEAAQVLASSGSRRSTFSKRKDSIAAAIILESFFGDSFEAVLVKPWRPPGSGTPMRQHAQEQQQRQLAAMAQQRQQQPAEQPQMRQ